MNVRNIICYNLFALTLSCGVIDSNDSNKNYNTLHGIDISNNGEKIFVSGRGDGKLHIFNTNDGDKSLSISLSENAMAAGIKYNNEKIYVSYQALDQVGIIDLYSMNIDIIDIIYSIMSCNDYDVEEACSIASGCEWMEMGEMNHCMESDGMMDMGSHTPHFIVIDDTNHYWFVTTITSGYVGRYNLDTNELIDKIMVGDSPALMVLNEESQKLYVSRMMPMGGMMMGSISTIIHEIDYSDPENMISSNEFELSSPAPHGLAINSDGSEIYATSNTADWVWKINTSTGDTTGSFMDSTIANTPTIETQRLKPIQCLSVNDNLLLITCSAGLWYNSFTGIQDTIPGQVQLWNTTTMSLVDTLQFSWKSKPWHIVNSPVDDYVFITLAGDNLYPGTSGVACLSYENDNLQVVWTSY